MASVRAGNEPGRGRLRRALSGGLALLVATTGFVGTSMLSAAPAGAAPLPGITFTKEPADPSATAGGTQDVNLQWTATASPAAPNATCELTRDGVEVTAGVTCNVGAGATIDVAYQASLAGAYELTITDPDTSTVATGSVTVVPGTPQVTAPPSGSNSTPAFTIQTFYSSPTATLTCTLTDPAGDVLQTSSTCTSPFTANDITQAPALGATGSYTLTAVQADDSQTSATGSAAYAYNGPARPGQPTPAFSPATGYTLTPSVSVAGMDPLATTTCTLTDPSGNDITSSALSGCGASPTVDLSNDPNETDGSYMLKVSQSLLGLDSGVGSATYELDTHTPVTPTLSGPSGPATSPTPSYDLGGIEPGDDLTCTVAGPTGSVTVDCSSATAAAVDLTGAKLGTYTVSVSQTDAAGKSSGTGTATYQYVGSGPATPVLNLDPPATSPGTTLTPTFTVSGLDSEPLTPACDISGVPASAGDTVTVTPATNLTDCSTTSIDVDLTGQPDGSYTVTELVTDSLGQKSVAGSATYLLDTGTPQPTVTTAATSPSDDTDPTFDIEDAETVSVPETYTCTLTAPDGSTSTPDCQAGSQSIAMASGDGHYVLEVDATDALGHTSSRLTDYSLDATTPVPTITRLVPTTAVGRAPNPTFDVSDFDAVDNAADNLSCEWTGPSIDRTGDCTSGVPAGFTDTDADGTYTLTVTATDTSPFANTATGSSSYDLDRLALQPTLDTSAAPASSASSYSRTASPQVTAIGHDVTAGPDTFLCSLTVPGGTAPGFTACPGTPVTDPTTQTSHQVLTVDTGQGDGEYVLQVQAQDTLTNVSAPVEFDYWYDGSTPAPTVTPVSPGALTDSTHASNVTNPQFSVNHSDGVSGAATLSCEWTGPVSDFSGAPLTPTVDVTDCAGPGQYTFPTAGDGEYTLTVTTTDAAGNTNFTTVLYYLRTATPMPSVVAASGATAGTPDNDLNPSFTITDNDPVAGPDTFTCTWELPGEPSTPAGTPCAAGAVSFPAGAGDGEYVLLVTATDQLGNAPSSTAEADYWLDTTAQAPTFSPSAASLSGPSSYTNVANPVITVNGQDSLEGPDGFLCSLIVPNGTAPTPTACTGPTDTLTGNLATQQVTIPTGSGDGEYQLLVTARDQLGNISQPAEFDYYFDGSTTAPTVTPSTPGQTTSTAPSNISGPTFVISYADPLSGAQSFSCAWTGPVAGFGGAPATPTVNDSTCPAPDGTGAYGFTTDGDGQYTLTVTGTDNAGNSRSTTVDYWLHSSAAAPTITPQDPGVVTTQNKPQSVTSPSFVITAPDSIAGANGYDALTCTWTGPVLDGSGVATTPTVTQSSCGTAQADPSNPLVDDRYAFPTDTDGEYVLTVTADDTAGNTSAAATFAYWLDATTPTPVITPASPAAATSQAAQANAAKPTFAVTDAETVDQPETFTCEWTGPVADSLGNAMTPTVDDTGCPAPDGSGDYQFSASGGDGEYRLTVTASDKLGNHSTSSLDYWYDSATPAPAITLLPVGSTTSQSAPSASQNPSFAIADTDPVSGPNTLTICHWTGPVLDGAGHAVTATVNVTACPAPDGSGDYSFQTAPSNGDGEYLLTVTGKDEAGNLATSAPFAYWVDSSTPAPVITPVAPTISTTSGSRSTVTAPTYTFSDAETIDPTASGTDTFTCTWTGPVADGKGNAVTPTVTQACPAPNGTGPYTFGTAADGEYVLTVTAHDAFDNRASTTIDYFLDTSTPAPAVSLSSPGISPSTVRKPTFSITDGEQWSTPETFSCTFTGPAPAATVVSSGPCTNGQQFDTTATGEGTYTLTVSATDRLGNQLTPSGTPAKTTISYTVDRSTPDPVITLLSTPALGRTSSELSPQFRIADSEAVATPVVFTCSWTGPGSASIVTACPTPTADPADASLNDVYQFSTAGLGDGTYTLTVSATDALGNAVDPRGTAAAATFAYTLDTSTLAPTVTPNGAHSQNDDPVFTFAEPADEAATPETFGCQWQSPSGTTLSSGPCVSGADFPTGDGPDGTYTLIVAAADSLGNSKTRAGAAAQTVVTYVLDRSTPAPVITLNSTAYSVPGDPNPRSSVRPPSFTLTDTEAVSLPVTLSCEWAGPGSTDILTDCTNGLSAPGVATNGDGTYTLTVTGTDAAANTATSSFEYDLDTHGPVAPTLTPGSADTNSRTVTFQVSGLEPDSTFTCAVTGTGAGATAAPNCLGGGVKADTGAPEGDGTITVPVTVTLADSAPDASYQFSVTPTDAVLNPGAAASATYQLDTSAPPLPLVKVLTASPSRNPNPWWRWQYAFNSGMDASDPVTCTITDPSGSASDFPCPASQRRASSPTLGAAGDGTYTFTVTVTDPAGNVSSESDAYVYRHNAPDGPSIFIVSPVSGAGHSRHPVWQVDGPAGTTLSCELHRGMSPSGPVIAGPQRCAGDVSFDLTGETDGGFTATVRAIDAGGHRSPPAYDHYVLAPRAPRVSPPTSQSSPAVWSVNGNPDDDLQCTLTRDGHVVQGPAGCGFRPSFDMHGLPRGRYTLTVVQIGPENVTGPSTSASWVWAGSTGDGGSPGGNQVTPPRTPTHPTDQHPKHPALPQGTKQIINHLIGRNAGGLSATSTPPSRPDASGAGASGFGDGGLAKSLRGVVSTITSAGGGTGFPLLLLALVIAFLIAQNRIDRRDPKLAFASAAADDMVDFAPPPSREDRP